MMREVITAAIDELCSAFERNGYNPTPIIDIGVLVASADGKVDQREREMLLDVFQTLLDTTLTPEVVDNLVTASLEVIEVAGAESRARLVASILQDCDAVEPALRVAIALSLASQGLTKAERKVVERLASAGGVTPARLAELTAEVSKYAVDGDPISVRQSIVPSIAPPPPSKR
jgi:tellurite resistance protein